ncbi:MAG: hypothetical protein ACM3H9_08940 [Rhodospirillaceae bacterium]
MIAAVAREMTEGEPSAALRARVLEQVEHGRRRSLPVVPRWAWARAAAVLTLAVLTGVWVFRPVPAPGGAQTAVAERQAGRPAPAAAGSERRERPPSAVSPAERPSVTRTAASGRAGRDAVARTVQARTFEDTHAVPALAEIEPLRFTAVEPDPLQIAAVEVDPLPPMPAIDIPSLDPGSNDMQSADSKKEK